MRTHEFIMSADEIPEPTSSLSLIASYYKDEELHQLECVLAYQAHFQDMDWSQPLYSNIGYEARWPAIRVQALDHLFLETKRITNPETGRSTWPPGTSEYARLARAKPRGVDPEALRLHIERTRSLAYSFLVLEQEDRGIDGLGLHLALKYFAPEAAILTMQKDAFQDRMWLRGRNRPTNENSILIVRGESQTAYEYAPFRLTA